MGEYGGFTVFTILFVAVWIVLNAICQVSVKTGLLQVKEVQEPLHIFDTSNLGKILSNKFIVAGFALYLVSTIFWFGAMSTLDISVLSPLGSLVFVMVAFLALFFLGEKITPVRWLGIFVIVTGVFLLAKS